MLLSRWSSQMVLKDAAAAEGFKFAPLPQMLADAAADAGLHTLLLR